MSRRPAARHAALPAALLLLALPACSGPETATARTPAAAVSAPAPVELPWRTSAAQPMTTVRGAALQDASCRMVLRLSAGGSVLRLRLSNVTNPAAVRLSAVTVGLRAKGAAARPGSLRPVTVGGIPGASLAAGQLVTTDPVALPTRPGDEVLVSFAVAGTAKVSAHRFGAATGACTAAGAGDRTGQSGADGYTVSAREGLVVDDVAVAGSPTAPKAVVGTGDSLTDAPLPPDTYPRWTDALAARMPGTPVVNAAIAGNRVLLEGGFGRPLVERFDRDVLQRSGVGTVVLLAGTNDVARDLSAARLQTELTRLCGAARAKGLRTVLMTIPPADERTRAQQQVRREVNAWIRTGRACDLVVDADAVLRDPGRPERLAPALDFGDGLHLSPAGHKALAAAVAEVLGS